MLIFLYSVSCKSNTKQTDPEKIRDALKALQVNGLLKEEDIPKIQVAMEILSDKDYLNRGEMPNFGDVIWANRMVKGYPFNHSGIYIGNGQVIHFTTLDWNDNNMENAIIHERSFEEFAQNCPVRVIKFMEGYSPAETVERARSRIGEKGYNLITNNCDNFATWAKTGKSMSIQVEGLEAILEMMDFDSNTIEKIKLFVNNKVYEMASKKKDKNIFIILAAISFAIIIFYSIKRTKDHKKMGKRQTSA